MDSLNTKIGQQILLTRRAQKISQAELAEKAELAINTIISIERGRYDAKISTVGKICKVLNITSISL